VKSHLMSEGKVSWVVESVSSIRNLRRDDTPFSGYKA
jgi:hypothetical protein